MGEIEGESFVIMDFGHRHVVGLEAEMVPGCGQPGHRNWAVTVSRCDGVGDADLIRALEVIEDAARGSIAAVKRRVARTN